MIKKTLLLSALATAGISAVLAANPIISERYTPDPAPYVHGDTLYLFVDHDEPEDIGYFNMKDWMLYSTTDMVNWTYRGTPVTTATFSKWAKQGNDAWASQCIERDGKWYWYVTATVEGKGYPGIGVAVADNPAGPYKDAIGKPLAEGWFYIDPTVFIDNDGQAYLFWGNNNLWYAKLNKNMTRLSGSAIKVNTDDQEAFGPWKGYDDNGKPKTNYEEAPWIYRVGDTYYLEYAAGGVPEHWAYSTATSIKGPWKYQGKVMGCPDGSFTIHGGSIDYKGHSYMFYHDGKLPGGGGFRRSTSIEEFKRGTDGSLPFIPFTKEGVKQIEWVDPYELQQAEMMYERRDVVTAGDGVTNYVNKMSRSCYFGVKGVDFGYDEARGVTVRVAAEAESTMLLRIDSRNGQIIAEVPIPATGGMDCWQEVTVPMQHVPDGVHDLWFTFSGKQPLNFDWWRFQDTTGVTDVACDIQQADGLEYNIDGTPYHPGQSGPRIVVSAGKKYLK